MVQRMRLVSEVEPICMDVPFLIHQMKAIFIFCFVCVPKHIAPDVHGLRIFSFPLMIFLCTGFPEFSLLTSPTLLGEVES